jgi:HK97 gp10 family phage protein
MKINLRSLFLKTANIFSSKIESILDSYNKSLPEEIRPYIEDNLWLARNPAYPKRYINRTNKLYNRTGNLVKALRINGVGNISNVIKKDNSSILEYGIDVQEIRYAEFNEFGTSKMRARPFLRPGIEKFRKDRLDQLQNKLFDEIKNAWNRI